MVSCQGNTTNDIWVVSNTISHDKARTRAESVLSTASMGGDVYRQLSDKEFLQLIFTSEDRLGHDFVDEAKIRKATLVPLLCEVLEDKNNYAREGEEFWGVVHAVNLLGILGDPSAVDALFAAREFSDENDIDWIYEALPECYCRLGTSIIPKLMRHVEDCKGDDYFKSGTEIIGLWNLWEAHPEERTAIEDLFIRLLKQPDTNPEIKAYLIGDFTQLGRKEYRAWFEEMFGKGEVDLYIFSREDLDYFFNQENRVPVFHYDLEKFYDAEEIEKRQQRWREEKRESERKTIEDEILQNYTRIGRNETCPCGSGKKFKKCHLNWAEEESRRLMEEEIEFRERARFRTAVSDEKQFESEIRRFLARKNQTELFSRIQETTEQIMKTPENEFLSRGLNYYLDPILSAIVFTDKAESAEFMDLLSAYVNVCSFLHENRIRKGKQEG